MAETSDESISSAKFQKTCLEPVSEPDLSMSGVCSMALAPDEVLDFGAGAGFPDAFELDPSLKISGIGCRLGLRFTKAPSIVNTPLNR